MSFNLIIDSLNGSGDDGNLTYGIDWSFLAPEQEYDMTFSYRSTAPYSAIDRQQPGTNSEQGGELYFPVPQGWIITGIGCYGVKMVHTGSTDVL